MATEIKLQSPEGVPFRARIVHPTAGGGGPGLVMVHEWFGLDAETERMAQQFADAGFVVAAIDVYGGKVANDENEARALMMAMNSLEAATLVGAAARHLATLPEVRGGVGVTGFCMGGAVTFVAACHADGVSAFVPFYGIPHPDRVDLARMKGPIEAHFAKVDDWATPDKARTIVEAVRAAGGRAELFTYDGGHAFMRASDPAVYHEPSARLAFERATAFLHRELDPR